MRAFVLIPVLCLYTFSAVNLSFATDFSDESVLLAARSSLTLFPSSNKSSSNSTQGLIQRIKSSCITFGTPLRVYTAFPDFEDEDAEKPSYHAVALNEWRVPVIIDGGLQSLLTVMEIDGVLRSFELEDAVLMKEFCTFTANHPDKPMALFSIDQLQFDFFVLNCTGESFEDADYYPLSTGRFVLPTDTPLHRSCNQLFDEMYRQQCKNQLMNH